MANEKSESLKKVRKKRLSVITKLAITYLMGIKPNGEDVQGEEHHRSKGNITRKDHREKVQDKIGRKFGSLTHQTI